MARSLITEANEQVSIVAVCRMYGLDLSDGAYLRKVHCPFEQLYHSDGGADPAMRIYPETNSAYCFSCSAYYTPVTLAAQADDVDRRTAAIRLLEKFGIRQQRDPQQVFAQLRDYTPPLDKALLAEALKTFCRRVDPHWPTRQFEPQVAVTLTRCLAILDRVTTDDEVTLWLSRCKTVMMRVLSDG